MNLELLCAMNSAYSIIYQLHSINVVTVTACIEVPVIVINIQTIKLTAIF